MKYEELDDDAKAKARDWMRECVSNEDIYYERGEDIDAAAMLGFAISRTDIYWDETNTAFSTGWRAESMALDKLIEDRPTDAVLAAIGAALLAVMLAHPHAIVYINAGSNNKSTHPAYMHVTEVHNSIDHEDPDEPEVDTIGFAVIQQARVLADWMHRNIMAEWEYQTADENLENSIIANEYDFDEDGSVQ